MPCGGDQCCICANSGCCLAGLNDDNFYPATSDMIVRHLKEGQFSNNIELMLSTLGLTEEEFAAKYGDIGSEKGTKTKETNHYPDTRISLLDIMLWLAKADAENTTPVMEEAKAMTYLLAKGARQLDICLRMLYDEKIGFAVEVVKNAKGKIEYHVKVNTDENIFERLRERYENLTR